MNKIKNFLLKNTNTRQTAVKNVFWLTAGQVGSRLFRALIIIYATRVLGAEGYGIFAYVLGLAGFFTIFADIGINQILTREVSKRPEEEKNYFATAFWIKIGLLVLTSALLIILAPHFSKIETAEALLPLAALLVIFDNLREFSSAYFRGKEKMELEALLITATNVAITIFGFIILTVWATPKTLTWTYVLSASTGSILGIIILRDKFAGIFKFFKQNLLRPILSSAWPISLMGVLGVFMLNTDIIMLGFFRTSAEIGYYSAGQKIVQVLYTIPSIFAAAMFPAFSRLVGAGEREKSRRAMEEGLSTVLMISLPMVVGGVVLGSGIVDFLYGQEFSPTIPAFQILIFSLIMAYPGALLGNYILAHDKQIKLAPYVAAASIGNVIFNFILIPLFGIIGAAVATLLSQLIYNGSAWRFAKKINNFKTLLHLKKIAPAALLMGLLSYALSAAGLHVLLTIAASALFYFGVLWVLKEKTLTELKSIVVSR